MKRYGFKIHHVYGPLLDAVEGGPWVQYEDHAADRAALVAQLEALKRRLNEASAYCEECQNRADVIGNLEEHIDEQKKRIVSLESADAVAGDHLKELVAQVAELTRERDEAREAHEQQECWTDHHMARVVKAEAEVTRLTRERDDALEALAAADAKAEHYLKIVKFDQRALEEGRAAAEAQRDRGNDLESEVTRLTARVRELEAERESATARASDVLMALESCEAQAQRDHELAAEWKATAEAYRVDAEVTRDRLAASEARVAAALRLKDAQRGALSESVLVDHMAEALRGSAPPAAPARTEAEQRVLDACAAWNVRKTPPSSTGQWSLIYGDVEPIADAELARREALRG